MKIFSSHFLRLLVLLIIYPKLFMAQPVKPPVSDFTKDTITKYLEAFKEEPLMTAMESFEASDYNYLVPHYLTLNACVDTSDVQLFSAYKMIRSTFSSFAGDVRENETSYIPTRHSENEIMTDSNYAALDAIEEVVAIARSEKVIMINESHIDPRGRVFMSALLPALKAEGFTYLFVEGLHDQEVNERGFPLQTSGFYTSEPMFGNLLRNAARLGFTLVPYDCYDTPCNTISEREQTQAENIYRSLKKDPHAKAIVFAGHGHINKDPEKKWMADRFKTLTGIDPFCINQSINSEAPQLFHHIREDIQKPVIYKNLETNVYREFSNVNKVDATIVYPATKWIDDVYADWMLQHGSMPYTINFSGPEYEGTLLSIVRSEEFEGFGKQAVPVINILLKKSNNQKILLESGSYAIRIIDLYGKEVHSGKMQL